MNIRLGKKSEALLKEMPRKNSHYGSVNIIINEAVACFYMREKKKDFGSARGTNVLLEHCFLRIRSCILSDALQVLS